MRILIINQHCKNRGDESAGTALLKNLLDRKKVETIKIIYNIRGKVESAFGLKMKDTRSESLLFNSSEFIYHAGKIKKFFLFYFPLWFLKIIFKKNNLNKEITEIKNADLVISAPGGINLSKYYFDWAYLWRIHTALRLKKKVAIYSPSIGPFKEGGSFSKLAITALKKVDFLSLRDIQSQKIADVNKINYLKSIDTSFLDFPRQELPDELSFLKEKDFAVFIPNQLYLWHPEYREISQYVLNELYFRIINFLISKNLKVILLPHLFCSDEEREYFNFFKKSLNNDSIIVLPQTFDHSIQEAIVRNSNFLVGSRYHSVVFAIKNSVPFFSLNYEHKMSGLLEEFNLKHCGVEILEYLQKKDISPILALLEKTFLDKNKNVKKMEQALNISREIAKETFRIFIKKFNL